MIENNQAWIIGTIASEFEISHSVFNETFYTAKLTVERLSGNVDTVIILVSERIMDVTKKWIGERVEILGNYRSYNKHENGNTKLLLIIFVREMKIINEYFQDKNEIFLDGYICREPTYRKTPFGREITDVILAVNRKYRKSDYIPCIFWGRNARYISTMNVGDRVRINGRIQSREYQKKIPDADFEVRTAYEVSVFKMEVI